jgi:outer membrane protein OmpA-like peptidoglycan-associated protein
MANATLAPVEASKSKAEPAHVPALKPHGPAAIPGIPNFLSAIGNMAIQRAAKGPLTGSAAAAILGGAGMPGGGCSCGGTCEECNKKPVQRKGEGDLPAVASEFHGAFQRSGSGMPLGPHVRSMMESSFGDKFDDVRVHDDSAAADSARHIHAHAFTTGRDIYFGQGRYEPHSNAGQKLLAHELTHVLQQRRGGVPPGLKSVNATAHDDIFEHEAEQAEARVGKEEHGAPAPLPASLRHSHGHSEFSASKSLQRKCACGGTCSKCSGEMEEQKKIPLQRKPESSLASSDLAPRPQKESRDLASFTEKQEAGHLAEQVMDIPGSRMPAASVSGPVSGVQRQAAGPPDPPHDANTEVACVKVNLEEENRLSHKSPGKVDIGKGPPPAALSLYNYGNDEPYPKPFHLKYLGMLGPLLARHHIPVKLAGHASCPGKAPHNWELSRHRAEIVAGVLKGVAKNLSIVEAKPFGESQPVADNFTVEGRSRNRAVDIIPLRIPPPVRSICEMFPALCRLPSICQIFPALCRKDHGKFCEEHPEDCRERGLCDWLPSLCDDDDGPSFCARHPIICTLVPFCLLAPEVCLACVEDPALCISALKCIINPASCVSPPGPQRPQPPGPVSVMFTRVRASNTPDGANDRIPDQGATGVAAIVTGWKPSMPPIRISADGAGGQNGDVLTNGVNEIFITTSAIIQVSGVSQTDQAAPDLPLSLRATMGPTPVGQSAPFAVADLMENMSFDLDHIAMTDPSLIDKFIGAARGVNVIKNDDAVGMVVVMDWDTDGARGRKSLDEVVFNFDFQVLAATGFFARQPTTWGGRWYGDRPPLPLEFVNSVPVDSPGELETVLMGVQDDGRSGSKAPITNSGFKLEEVVKPDPHPSGCLRMEMSLTGTSVNIGGFRSSAGQGVANATIPIECPGQVKEDPLTAATAKTVPTVVPHLDRTGYGTGTLTLNSRASNTVGVDMMTRFLTFEHSPGSDDTDKVQKNIYGFGKLPQRGAFGGSGYKAEQVYIKGHLLNAKLGGLAEDRNLFPITGQANKEHEVGVERAVKDLILDRQLVAQYGVRVAGLDGPHNIDVLGDGTCTYEYLNADFHCSYGTYKLYTDNRVEPNPNTDIPIHSTFDLSGFISGVRGKNCPEK